MRPASLTPLILIAFALSWDSPARSAPYGGGSGDGFAHGRFLGTLNGVSHAGIFAGGPGDGFDQASVTGFLRGPALSTLYSGGPGDGHTSGQFLGSLGGVSVLGLYLGGPGDGFDQNALVSVPLNSGCPSCPDDADGDGLPDAWEQQYFMGNVNPSDDADGDGANNLEEYIADTNPTNALSLFLITSFTFNGEEGILTFPTSSQRVYTVQSSTHLVTNAWQSLGTGQFGSGGDVHVGVTNLSGSGFYRVRVDLPP